MYGSKDETIKGIKKVYNELYVKSWTRFEIG